MASRKWRPPLSQRLRAAAQARASRRYLNNSSALTAPLSPSGRVPKRIMVFGDSNDFRPNGGNTCWATLLENIDVHAILDNRTDLEPDKIHLNAAGRQKVADAVWVHVQNAIALP